jgi:uncharacterized protein YfdQ (DUF2303 family)
MGQHEQDTPTPGGEWASGTISTTVTGGGDAATIVATAQEAVEPRELDKDKLYAVRDREGALVTLNLERYRDEPERARGTYLPATVASFLDYVKRFAEARTTIWVHPTEAKVVAVLDDNGDGIEAKGWRQHVARLELIPTPEWLFWKEKDGQLMDQQTFAEHIEDGLAEVVEPTGAKMLEIAQSIQTTTGVAFHSGFDLGSGEVKFRYDEKIEAKAGEKGDLIVPQSFELGIAPYIGEDAYRIKARFRFRNRGGTLQLGYKLDQPELAERTVLEGIGERIGAELGETAPVYLGGAPQGSPLG